MRDLFKNILMLTTGASIGWIIVALSTSHPNSIQKTVQGYAPVLLYIQSYVTGMLLLDISRTQTINFPTRLVSNFLGAYFVCYFFLQR